MNGSESWKFSTLDFFFFFLRGEFSLGLQDSGLLAHIALYLSFKFIGGCLGVRPPYQRPQSRSASPLLFVPDPSWQSPTSASLPFPTPSIHIACVQMFPFQHRISCMRESLVSSSCAAFIADWYARLGALSTFCNVSCPVYLWTVRTYQLVPSNTVGWPITSHRLSILSVSFFQNFGVGESADQLVFISKKFTINRSTIVTKGSYSRFLCLWTIGIKRQFFQKVLEA